MYIICTSVHHMCLLTPHKTQENTSLNSNTYVYMYVDLHNTFRVCLNYIYVCVYLCTT